MKKYFALFLLASILFIGESVYAQNRQGILPSSVECSGGNLATCVKTFYQFGVGAVAILAVVVMMWGGLMWTMSGGNVSRIETAKEWIYGSVLGLVIALSSFLLLNTINPQLTFLKLGLPNTPGVGPKTEASRNEDLRPILNQMCKSNDPCNEDICYQILDRDKEAYTLFCDDKNFVIPVCRLNLDLPVVNQATCPNFPFPLKTYDG